MSTKDQTSFFIEHFSKLMQDQYFLSRNLKGIYFKGFFSEANYSSPTPPTPQPVQLPIATEIIFEQEIKSVKRIKKLNQKLLKICNNKNFRFWRASSLMMKTSLAILIDFFVSKVLFFIKKVTNNCKIK